MISMEPIGRIYFIGNPEEKAYEPRISYLEKMLRNYGFNFDADTNGRVRIYAGEKKQLSGFIEKGYFHTLDNPKLDDLLMKVDFV